MRQHSYIYLFLLLSYSTIAQNTMQLLSGTRLTNNTVGQSPFLVYSGGHVNNQGLLLLGNSNLKLTGSTALNGFNISLKRLQIANGTTSSNALSELLVHDELRIFTNGVLNAGMNNITLGSNAFLINDGILSGEVIGLRTIVEINVDGECPTLTTNVSGNSVVYQWQFSTNGVNNWLNVPQATNAFFNVIDIGYYRCKLTAINSTYIQYTPVNQFGNAVSPASLQPSLCIHTELPQITHTTMGATGIGTPTGLPAGVTAIWSANIITISGTPTNSGVFNYSIPLTGGCGAAFATGTITVTGLPCGWIASENGINCNNGSSASYNWDTNVFSITSNNCYHADNTGSDQLAIAHFSLCGNSSITAQVTSIGGSNLGWAGVIMRENSAAGAKKAQLMTNLSTLSRREFRTTTNGSAIPQQFQSQNRYWLRITRTGNQFVMYVSLNGLVWSPAGAQTIIMENCIDAGLVVTNYNANSMVTATFANVNLTGESMTLPKIANEISSHSLAENDISMVKIMPNPTFGKFEIDIKSAVSRSVIVDIYGTGGNLIKSHTFQNGQTVANIDISDFKSNIYIIKIKQGGAPDIIKRLVKVE